MNTLKIFEKVLDARLRKLVSIMDCQFGFRSEKSCSDAIFIARILQAKYLEKKRRFHIFVDLKRPLIGCPGEPSHGHGEGRESRRAM